MNVRPHPMLLPLLAFCQLVTAIDYNIVLVALPPIQAGLGFSEEGLQWVVSAYALAFGGTLLFAGRISDLFGRKLAMNVGLILYGVGSLAAALAPVPAAVIAGRAVQGLGGALLTPAVLTTIFASFPEGPQRFRALSVWSGAGAVGLAAGSALGGILTSTLGWRAVFAINVPLVVVGLVGTMVAMPRVERSATRPAADIPGGILATIASVGIVLALAEGPVSGWDTGVVLGAAIAGAAALVAFIVVEGRSPEPLLPLKMLRNRTLVAGLVAMFIFLGSIGTVYYVFSLFLQDVLGNTALATGIAFLPWGVGAMLGSRLGRASLNRWGISITLIVAFGLSAVAIGGLAASLHTATPIWVPIAWTVVLAPAQAMGFASLFASAAHRVEPRHQGVASALMSTFQQVGNAAGLAVLGGIAASIATKSGTATVRDTADGLALATWIAAALMVLGIVVVFVSSLRRAASTEIVPAD